MALANAAAPPPAAARAKVTSMTINRFLIQGMARRFKLAGVVLLALQWAAMASGQVTVQPPALPPGLLGSSYGTLPVEGGGLRLTPQVYTAQGGTAPYSFRVSGGSLPPGVGLNANGSLQGAPLAQGSFTFTVEASDANRQTGTTESTISVGPRAQLGLSGRVGMPFRYQRLCGLDAAAQATYSYATNGNPPPGITFHATSSTFSGTPAEEGTYVVIWGCTSQTMGLSFSFEMVFAIGAPVRITLNPATVGQAWSFTPTRLAPGQPPFQFVVQGDLPPGLARTAPAQGTISGVPSEPGSYSWSLRRTDSSGTEAIAFYDLRVNELTGFLPSLSAWNIVRQAGTPPVSTDVYVNANPAGLPYELRVQSEGGEWLSAGPATGEAPARLQLTADISGLEPGRYTGTVTIAPPAGSGGAGSVDIPVNLEVQPSGPPRLRFSRTSVEIGAGSTTSVMVTNVGGDSARGLEVFIQSQRGWLKSASLSRDELKPGESLVLQLESESVSFDPGNYAGFARISAENVSSVSLPVNLKVRAGVYCYFEPAVISLSTHATNIHSGLLKAKTRLRFANAEEATGAVPWKMHQLSWLGFILNPKLPLWLNISPMEGSGETEIEVSVDPAGFDRDLQVGEHLIGESFGVKGCQNELQIRVKVTGSEVPLIETETIFFPFTFMLDNPKLPVDPLFVWMYPRSPEWLDYSIAFDKDLFSVQASSYFTVTPREGRIERELAKVMVQSFADKPATPLQPSPYRPTFIFYFSKAGRTFGIKFLTFWHTVVPFSQFRQSRGTGRGSGTAQLMEEGAVCKPENLDVMLGLPAPLSLQVGEPQELTVTVADSCGQRVTDGAMEVEFSNGDAPLTLTHVKDGKWSGTWIPRLEGESVMIRLRAQAGALEGEAMLGASVLDSSLLPVLSGPGAVRNAASEAAQGMIAPGTRITIRGRRLATGHEDFDAGREPAEVLGGARVLLGETTLPLLAATETQLVALIPPGAALPPEANLVVATEHGVSDSLPLLAMAAAPGIYTVDGSGAGQGVIYWINAEGQRILADEKNPAPRDAECLLVATGLGALQDESASPAGTVTLTVGEVEVEQVEAIQREGRPGVYEVRFKLPAGISGGGTVPVSLTTGGVTSQTVSFAAQ